MPSRPTNQQLIGMTPQQILGIFGGAGKEYEKYIPEYNRVQEDLARKQHGIEENALGLGAQQSLESILYGSQQAQAKSGFAGSGAINKASNKAREGTIQGFQSQLEGLNVGLEQRVAGFQADYASDVYSALGRLANLEAFKNDSKGGGGYQESAQFGGAAIAQSGVSLPSTGFGGGANVGAGQSFNPNNVSNQGISGFGTNLGFPSSMPSNEGQTSTPWIQYNMTESQYNEWQSETGGDMSRIGEYSQGSGE